MSSDQIEQDLAFALQLARSAGQRARALRSSQRWQGEILADVGDQAIDGFLQGSIRARHPEDGILSEETADTPERLERERVWVIDPIDGTKEYSQLRHDWAVHVALTIEGRCALGVVALPSIDTLLWGVTVEGRESRGIEGNGFPVAAAFPDPDRSPRLLVSRSRTSTWVDRLARSMQAQRVPCGSVGYKVSRLLAGEADLYARRRGLMEWDICAPEAVARAFGWQVSTLRGEQHVYNRADPLVEELLICAPAWRERVLELVAASADPNVETGTQQL